MLIRVCLTKWPPGFIYRSCLSCQVVLNSCKLNESRRGWEGISLKNRAANLPVSLGEPAGMSRHPWGSEHPRASRWEREAGAASAPARGSGLLHGDRGHCRGARGLSDEGKLGGIFIACLSAGPGRGQSPSRGCEGSKCSGQLPKDSGMQGPGAQMSRR